MMNNLGKLTLILLLVSFSNLTLAKVSAYLSQDTFYEGDAITLNIESNMNTNAKPDLTVLEKDFKILGTGTNAQINIFNGQRSFKRVWTVKIQAKATGAIEIPAISIGNEETQSIRIKISALPPEIKAETNKHIFIETSVGANTNDIYVQQQIPYSVKLYFDSAMQSGEISQPDIDNSVVEELTRDKRYSVMRGDKKFSVIEKHFTISPEKSGLLHIPATTVSGRIALSGGDSPKLRQRMDNTEMLNKFFNNFGNDPFLNDPFFKDNFRDSFFRGRRSVGPSQPFSIKSKTIDINVLPVPKAFTGLAWLPAEELNVRDSWAHTPPELKVGEPVTRTLILRAKGLGGSQIPTLNTPKPDSIKIYPEQSTSKTHTDGVTLIGRQYTDITYIPQKEGKITIPETKVDWWNTKTKKQETFILPAWHLNVASGVLTNTDAINSAQQEPTQSTNDKKQMAHPDRKDKDAITSNSTDTWGWKLPVLSLLLLLIVASLFYGINRRRKNTHKTAKQQPQANINALKKVAINACNNNDKKTATSALINLTQAQWSNTKIQNLGAIASNLESGANSVRELETSLYAPNAKAWNGQKLRALIEAGLRQKKEISVSSDGPLKPLYPETIQP